MMLIIVQSNRELARSSPIAVTPPPRTASFPQDSAYGDAARRIASQDRQSIYFVDQPVDMSSLTISPSNGQNGHSFEHSDPYMFIPADPRTYYRLVAKEALVRDLHSGYTATAEDTDVEPTSLMFLSKQSVEVLHELGARWRIPYASRLVLLLDVVREMFQGREIGLEIVDAAFSFMKEPPPDKKKVDMSSVLDRTRWTIRDFVLNQQILSGIHETLLRDLFEQLQNCYETKPPDIGAIMTVLETRIYEDPFFSKTPEDLDRFSDQLESALQAKAREAYHDIFMKEVGSVGEQAEFFHIIQFGKAVMKLAERIRKRYSKAPQIMGYVFTHVEHVSSTHILTVLNHMLYSFRLRSLLWHKTAVIK